MYDKTKKFDVPIGFLMKKIDKDTRIMLIDHIRKGYEKAFPNMKTVLAYLNWNPEIPIDYLYMGQACNDSGKPFILYDLVGFGSRRSIPGFHYCITHDITSEFFYDGFSSMVPIEIGAFNQIIQQTLNLSLKKGEPNYWKTRENVDRLIGHLTEITLRYQPQIIV